MTKYRVHFTGAKGSKVIESDGYYIRDGVLQFPKSSSIGSVAYSQARWLEVEEVENDQQ